MSDDMKIAVEILQEAVNEELERKAKLGYNAVITDENGKVLVVPASSLIKPESVKPFAFICTIHCMLAIYKKASLNPMG